ncbi:hypothetical protein [Brevundimonas sp.]|uniref:hypothetical protein n=1 Tax=Brevundimonas sp. TaxID=1871086 RepID=UPI0026316580|nr:hypothetical protein [Brevundimonas sp.]
MEDLFRSYWWLLFPLGWFVSIGFSSLLNYRKQKDALQLIRTYAERGEQPPEALMKVLDRPIDAENESRAYDYGSHGRNGPVFSLVLFTMLGAGFGYASYADIYGAGDAFLIVAFVMGALAAATLVSLLFGRSRQD